MAGLNSLLLVGGRKVETCPWSVCNNKTIQFPELFVIPDFVHIVNVCVSDVSRTKFVN